MHFNAVFVRVFLSYTKSNIYEPFLKQNTKGTYQSCPCLVHLNLKWQARDFTLPTNGCWVRRGEVESPELSSALDPYEMVVLNPF